MNLQHLEAADLRDPHGYSVKWHYFPADVLPMWVADMDYPICPAIPQAIAERLASRVGYPKANGDDQLLQAIIADQARHGLTGLEPSNLLLTTSVVPGIYASVLALSGAGDEVITQVPVYHPFLYALADYGRVTRQNSMLQQGGRWEIDFDHLETLVSPASRMLMLCNPQNPTGRVFTRAELEKLAEFALRHRLWIMSDELWANLVLDGTHVPIASLSPEVAQRTVTLTGPCKTFNTAGLGGGVAISHNKKLLEGVARGLKGIGGHPNVLGMTAWLAGLQHGQEWLDEVKAQLRANRNLISTFVRERMPQVGYVAPEATYLAWFDFTKLPFAAEVNKTMLEQAKIGFNDGAIFGPQYQGWLRMNFATGHNLVQEALERMEAVVRRALD